MDKKKYVIVFVIVTIIIIVLGIFSLTMGNKGTNKVLINQDYLIEKTTDITNDEISKLPVINLNSDDANEANDEILKTYYDYSYNSEGYFTYQYDIYKNVLSLLIKTIDFNETDFGEINYITYNFNIKTGEKLSDDKLLKEINVSKDEVDSKVEERLKYYFDNCEPYVESSKDYNKFLKYIEYDKTKERITIKDGSLYVFHVFEPNKFMTDDYKGNFNEIKIVKLK